MEPQQEKERMMLQYLTYALFGVMLLVICIVIYNDSRNPTATPYSEQVIVPEINLLSQEDFQIERSNLIEYQQAKNTSLSQDEINGNSKLQSSQPVIMEKTISPSMIAQNADPILEEQVIFKKVKTIEPDGTVIYENITQPKATPTDDEIRSLSTSGEKNFIFLEGTIHRIDLSNRYIILMQNNGQGLATFKYDDRTIFLINGKNFTVNNLTAGDSITVEGYGYEGTAHVLSTNVVTLKEAFIGF